MSDKYDYQVGYPINLSTETSNTIWSKVINEFERLYRLLNYGLNRNEDLYSSLAKLQNTITSGFTMPVGTICPFKGDTSDLPTGWYECDGNNGTPDLSSSVLDNTDCYIMRVS